MRNLLTIFTDGGASNNPGPAAIGVIVKLKIKNEKARKAGFLRNVKIYEEKTIHKFGRPIGYATNNVAEYTAVIEALNWLVASGKWRVAKIKFYLDSKLVVNQLNGVFKIKNYQLRNLAIKIRQLEQEAGGCFRYQYIPREKNQEADALVKKALVQS